MLLVVPRGCRSDFAPLVDAYRRAGFDAGFRTYASAMPDVGKLAGESAGLDAILLAGSARHSPRTRLPGPTLVNGAGRRIPAAWLPIRSHESTRRFAAAAARAHARAGGERGIAVLGQWHPRYLKVADRVEQLLGQAMAVFRWTGERIGRSELVGALGAGLGLAVYLGHGRPMGWVGYYGMRSRHFDGFEGEPVGALLSLCCETASRRRVGLSFSEALVLQGVVAGSLGAVEDTLHTDNTRWAVRICEVLGRGHVDRLGDLVVESQPHAREAHQASRAYRLIGDPLAPILSDAAGVERARAVVTHP